MKKLVMLLFVVLPLAAAEVPNFNGSSSYMRMDGNGYMHSYPLNADLHWHKLDEIYADGSIEPVLGDSRGGGLAQQPIPRLQPHLMPQGTVRATTQLQPQWSF